jgi:hypothetical protein
MKSAFYFLIFVVSIVSAQKKVNGSVTYIAAGSVYLSIGREQGLEDSLVVNVFRNNDSVAVLQIFAVSSKSSVCRIKKEFKKILIGDSIASNIPLPKEIIQPERAAISEAVKNDSAPERSLVLVQEHKQSWIQLRGRIGLQYNAIFFDQSSLNMQQPGLLVSLRGDLTDTPIKFDMYGTLRKTGRNGLASFSSKATNDSRIYRMSMEYDDQKNIIAVGRILPLYASSSGYVDGVSLSRRFGKFISGVSIGYQPDVNLQMPSPDIKKFVLFGYYQGNDSWNSTASSAYSRIWSTAGIERETFSSFYSVYSPSGFSLYTSSDIDLRSLSGGKNEFAPSLSLFIGTINYRFIDWLTAGIGIDASRPVYSLSSNKTIPDSLLDKQLRSGMSLNFNLSFWRGTGVYNSTTLRFGEAGFGKEYSNSSNIYYHNAINSGVNIRLNFLINENTVAHTNGYGIALQRNVFGADCGIRYQQNKSEIRQLGIINITTTLGADLSIFLTRQLTFIGSYDKMDGLGSTSRSLFMELSWRF